MISDTERRWQINAALIERGFEYCEGTDRYQGQVRCGHVKIRVELRIPDLSFCRKPTVHILERSEIPSDVVAHTLAESGICYSDENRLRLDPYSPAGSILRVLEEVEKTLDRSMNSNAIAEIEQEYLAYWSGASVLFPYAITGSKADGALFEAPTGQAFFAPKGTEIAVPVNKPLGPAIVLTVDRALTVQTSLSMTPSDIGALREWWRVNGMDADLPIENAIERLGESDRIFVQARNGIVGVGCCGRAPRLPSHQRKAALKYIPGDHEKITRLAGLRADLGFITRRNTDTDAAPLAGKRIALVGCGTIGSHLARMLAQVGAGQEGVLALIDNDFVTPGNLGRHTASFDALHENKAVALKNELDRFHPDIAIEAVEDLVQRVWTKVSNMDLVVDATGCEGTSEWINEQILGAKEESRPTAVIHSWVFGNGVAAQCLIHRPGMDAACYRCLRPDIGKPWKSSPMKRPNEKTVIVPTQCGDGSYVPFSVAASSIAAAIALDATIDAARGKFARTLRTRIIDLDKGNSSRNGNVVAARSSACPACGEQDDSD